MKAVSYKEQLKRLDLEYGYEEMYDYIRNWYEEHDRDWIDIAFDHVNIYEDNKGQLELVARFEYDGSFKELMARCILYLNGKLGGSIYGDI